MLSDFQLGAWRVQPQLNRLTCEQEIIRLEPKMMGVLLCLAQRSGEVVPKEQLVQEVWRDTFVTDDVLIRCISELRKAFGDNAGKPTVIETIPKRGYRLLIPVQWREATPDRPASGVTIPSRPEWTAGNLIGKKVSHYRVLEVLGGGMGVVYKAEDLKLGCRVALKFLPDELGNDPKAVERFEREARAASSLDHPNICPIHEFGEHEGQHFLVMQLLKGETLRERIEARTGEGAPFATSELLRLALQIADALDAAHQKGIIHRDIKPANIFITNRGDAKLLDFGLAKLTELEPSTSSAERQEKQIPSQGLPAKPPVSNPHISRTGTTMGTASYMSPEQVRGEPLDSRTDLFSFGAVLYEMATRREPVCGDTVAAIHDGIVNRILPPPVCSNPDLPGGFEAIISKALEKDRNLRYQHASEMRVELQRLKRDFESGHSAASSGTVAVPEAPAVRAAKLWKITVPVLTVALLVAGGVYYRSHHSKGLTEKDTIFLAEFTNKTGDPVFDGTLRQGLAIQLEQSPFLSLVSEQQIQQTLQMMGQKPDAKLTPELARELCQRTASAALLDGSIAQVGTQYLLTLKAVDCVAGKSLASTEAQASDENHVLDALGKTALEIRNKLGESLSTMQKFDTPLEQATTPSLEALRAFSLGNKVLYATGSAAAIPFFKHAIELDPNFALAYAWLGRMYEDIGESGVAADYTRKAYELRDRTSELENYFISTFFHIVVTGNMEKAEQSCELWIQAYPRSDAPHDFLAGLIYPVLGQYEEAAEEGREAVRLNPNFPFSYASLMFDYIALNRLDEAKATYGQALDHKLNNPFFHIALYQIAFLQNDAAEMAQQVARTADQPGAEDELLSLEADTAAYSGRLRDAREFSRRAMDSAQRAKKKEPAAAYSALSGLREALFGNADEARRRVTLAMGRSAGRDVQYGALLALAYAGDDTKLRVLTNDLGKRFPEDTIVQLNYLPTLRAKYAVSKGNAPEAIENLRAAAPDDLAQSNASTYNWTVLYPVFVRGEAYLAAHRGSEAAAEFQKILDHRGVVLNEPIGALAHLGVARAYAMQGNIAKAKTAYQDLFALWKDADPDIPILKRAKSEYARLQ